MRFFFLFAFLLIISTPQPVLAVDKSAIDITCRDKGDSVQRDNCCEQQKALGQRSHCIGAIRGRLTYCDQIHETDARLLCFARVTHKDNYCPRIKKPEMRAECEGFFKTP